MHLGIISTVPIPCDNTLQELQKQEKLLFHLKAYETFDIMYPAKDIQVHLYDGNNHIYRFHERLLDTEAFGLDLEGDIGYKGLDHYHRAGLAIITTSNDASSISSVRYKSLEKISAPGPIANVKSYHYIPDCSKNLLQNDYYFERVKAGLKAQKSLNKLLAFLSGGDNTKRWTGITVGKRVIVEGFGAEEKEGEKAIVNFTQYCETKFTAQSPFLQPFIPKPSPPSSDEARFFSLRSSNFKARDKIEEFSSAEILSGICLFSQEQLGYFYQDLRFPERGSGTNKEPSDHLTPLPFDFRPTLYEIETLIRLPNAIADIVSTLPAVLDVNITLDIPRVQYYAFYMDLYAQGRCSKGHVNSWFEVIDRRHDQLAAVFVKAVNDALKRRGINRNNVRIGFSTGLEEVVPYIRETIDQGNAPSVEGLLHKILELDLSLREYYEYLPEHQRLPNNLVSLCFNSYSCQVLRPVFRRVQEQRFHTPGLQKNNPQDRQLLIHIDNPSERRIYYQAEKILKKYQKKYSYMINPLLLGFFPSELVFTAGNTGRTSLYLQNVGQYIFDESTRRVVSPSDVLERVYGRDVTRRVVCWMKQEGMVSASTTCI